MILQKTKSETETSGDHEFTKSNITTVSSAKSAFASINDDFSTAPRGGERLDTNNRRLR